MNINQIYSGGDYLRAEDLKGRDVTVTINGYQVQEFENDGKRDKKVVLQFAGTDRALVCNKTNAANLASAYGEEVDNWVGQKILMRAERVMYAGRLVDGLRAYPVGQAPATHGQAPADPLGAPQRAAAPAASQSDAFQNTAPSAPAQAAQAPAADVFGDDIPF